MWSIGEFYKQSITDFKKSVKNSKIQLEFALQISTQQRNGRTTIKKYIFVGLNKRSIITK